MSLTCPHCHKPFTLVAAAAAAPATAAPAGPLPPAGAAPTTMWLCPVHRRAKIVPAGVSKKTGKEYPAFWACAEQGCDEKPPRGFPVPGATVAPQPAPAPVYAPPAANEVPLPPEPTDLEELPF